jgi:hypothetical protein
LIYQKSCTLDKASESRVIQLEVEIFEIFCDIINEGTQKGLFKKVDVDFMAHMWVLKRGISKIVSLSTAILTFNWQPFWKP